MMTSPRSLPESTNVSIGFHPSYRNPRTKRNAPIFHPSRNLERLIRREPSNLIPREQIPYYRRLLNIAADHQPPRPSLADIVHGDECYRGLVPVEPPLDGQCIVMEAQDRFALREEEYGGRSGAWMEVELRGLCIQGTRWRRRSWSWFGPRRRRAMSRQLAGGHGDDPSLPRTLVSISFRSTVYDEHEHGQVFARIARSHCSSRSSGSKHADDTKRLVFEGCHE